MAEGTITSLRPERGFGFLRPDGERGELFFHASEVEGTTFEALREGARVAFEADADPRHPGRRRAERVRPLG